MHGFLEIMVWPFLACLVLTGIHAYLGLHVIEREVIFVDLALAQIAAFGGAMALAFGQGLESGFSYGMSLGFTLLGAGVFSLTRFKKKRIPQEAFIGITYAVSAAALVMVLSRSGEGDEHIREMLVGNILLIHPAEVIKILGIYSLIGLFHYVCRKRFLLISQDPEEARKRGWSLHFWDFLFYASFGVVVTSSVKIAGVLLVFCFLIVPAAAAMLYSEKVQSRLIFGWIFGVVASLAGIAVSYFLDFPTGASVVCAFGALLLTLFFFKQFLQR